jgi:predicted nucleic acid-binding protein
MKWVEVLGRKFDWPEEDVAEVRSQIERFAEKVMPKTVLDAVKADPDDNRILECALAAGSDFIVSGDKDLLRLGTYDSYSLFDNRLHPEGVCFRRPTKQPPVHRLQVSLFRSSSHRRT